VCGDFECEAAVRICHARSVPRLRGRTKGAWLAARRGVRRRPGRPVVSSLSSSRRSLDGFLRIRQPLDAKLLGKLQDAAGVVAKFVVRGLLD
jgi:hypothetical protein